MAIFVLNFGPALLVLYVYASARIVLRSQAESGERTAIFYYSLSEL